MPTYDYQCDACGHRFEKFQSIKAAPSRKCPKCGKNQVKRLLGTGAGIIFKGSGFYITDYRSESYKNAAKSDSPGGAKEAKADSTTSEPAKPETKAEVKPAASTQAKPAAKHESRPTKKHK